MPLSRLPRVNTQVYTQAGFADFSKKMMVCGTAENTKGVKPERLNVSVRPTAVYKLDAPLKEPFEVKYVIQPKIHTQAHSGVRTMDITDRINMVPTVGINNDNIKTAGFTNVGTQNMYVNNTTVNTDRYIQEISSKAISSIPTRNIQETSIENMFDTGIVSTKETNPFSVSARATRNIQETSIENMFDTGIVSTKDTNPFSVSARAVKNMNGNIENMKDLNGLPIKSIQTIAHAAPISGSNDTPYIHSDIILDRNLPQHTTHTNLGDTRIYRKIEHEAEKVLERNIPNLSFTTNSSKAGDIVNVERKYTLPEKLQSGSFHIPPTIPKITTTYNETMRNNKKTDLRKTISAEVSFRR